MPALAAQLGGSSKVRPDYARFGLQCIRTNLGITASLGWVGGYGPGGAARPRCMASSPPK